MDRPAYELVRLLQAVLDDADQMTDTPEDPNNVRVWAVREVLEEFGGTPHRWSHPRCDECDHTVGFHHQSGGCFLCDCMLSGDEVLNGRDTELDDAIERALSED